MDNSAGDEINADLGMWNFGEGVEKKFDSHVRKSVPGYDLSHQLVSLLSDPFIKKCNKIRQDQRKQNRKFCISIRVSKDA